MHRHLSVLGRILICAIFLASAFGKVTDFDGTREMMVSKGVPQANWMLMGAIVFEVVGGLCVLLGFKAKSGAFLLLVFLALTTFYFHSDLGQQQEQIQFMKNLAIGGGLLFLMANGPGAISMDSRVRR